MAQLQFLLLIVAVLPFLALLSFRAMRRAPAGDLASLTPRSIALQTMLLQFVLAGSALFATVGSGIAVAWRSELTLTTVLAALGVVALALLVAWIDGTRTPGPEAELRRKLRQVGALDPWWLATAFVAAFSEEFAYRGVLVAILGESVGPEMSYLASAVVFGLAHLGQGLRGFAFSFAFGLAMQGLVLHSGGLLLACLAHLSYDVAAAALGKRLAGRTPA